MAKERNLAVLDSQRDEEVSILFLGKIPGLSDGFDSLKKNYTCDYLIGSASRSKVVHVVGTGIPPSGRLWEAVYTLPD